MAQTGHSDRNGTSQTLSRGKSPVRASRQDATSCWVPMNYETLPDQHIRLITLQGTKLVYDPAWPAEDLAICVSMSVVDFRAPMRLQERYAAVSYAWGSMLGRRPIVCDGMLLSVTSNLYNLLWTLLFHTESLAQRNRLWVDAICINQSDNHERSQQVSIMGDIYASAEKVIAWLGSGADLAHDDLDDAWSLLQENMTVETNIQAVSSLIDFLQQCRWFRRAWTFQEIALASTSEVRYGTFCADWAKFRAIISQLQDQRLRHHFVASEFGGKSPSMLRLLSATQNREATNPRDRIFALLGLYNGVHRISPDYEKSVDWAWAQAIIAIIIETQSLSILDFGDIGGQFSVGEIERLSWIPNLQGEEDFANIHDTIKKRDANNLIKLHPSFEPNISIDEADLSLGANGVVLGWGDMLTPSDSLWEFIPSWISRLPECAESPLHESADEAFQDAWDERDQHHQPHPQWGSCRYRPLFQSLLQLLKRLQIHRYKLCSCKVDPIACADSTCSTLHIPTAPPIGSKPSGQITLLCLLFSSSRVFLVQPQTLLQEACDHKAADDDGGGDGDGDGDDVAVEPQPRVSVVSELHDNRRMTRLIEYMTHDEFAEVFQRGRSRESMKLDRYTVYEGRLGALAGFDLSGSGPAESAAHARRTGLISRKEEEQFLTGELDYWRSPRDILRTFGFDYSWVPTRFTIDAGTAVLS